MGTLVCFIAGTYMSYHVTSYVLILLPILFLVCFIRLPETPQHLIKCNKIEAAEGALKFLRGYTTSPEHLDQLKEEMGRLMSTIAIRGKEGESGEDSSIRLADFGKLMRRLNLFSGQISIFFFQVPRKFAKIMCNAKFTILRLALSHLGAVLRENWKTISIVCEYAMLK